MRALTNVLSKILQVICVILFAALVVIVVWQVIARQVLQNPSAWSEEASRMTFVWLGLFAAALVFSERGHIAVDFVVRTFSAGAQKTVAIIVQLLIIFFAVALLIVGGWIAAQGAGNQRLAALSFLTLGQMYMVMPITGVIITLFAIDNIINIANGTEPAFPASEEEELIDQLEAEGSLPHEAEVAAGAAGSPTAGRSSVGDGSTPPPGSGAGDETLTTDRSGGRARPTPPPDAATRGGTGGATAVPRDDGSRAPGSPETGARPDTPEKRG